MEIKKVKVNELKRGPIRHEVLSRWLVQRIKAYKKILAEVEKTSLEETLDNFKRDINPEREAENWENIAVAYRVFVGFKNLTEEIKKEVFEVAFLASMGMEDFSQIKLLKEEDIRYIVNTYKGEKVIFRTWFSEAEIQQWAESNFERELTDLELNRIFEGAYDCMEAMNYRTDLLHALIENALDDKGNQWSEVDKDFLARSNTTTK